MYTYLAHIFGKRKCGSRDEVKLKLFNAAGDPIDLESGGSRTLPVARYEGRTDAIAANDLDWHDVELEAAPIFDPSVFELEDGKVKLLIPGLFMVIVAAVGVSVPEGDDMPAVWLNVPSDNNWDMGSIGLTGPSAAALSTVAHGGGLEQSSLDIAWRFIDTAAPNDPIPLTVKRNYAFDEEFPVFDASVTLMRIGDFDRSTDPAFWS